MTSLWTCYDSWFACVRVCVCLYRSVFKLQGNYRVIMGKTMEAMSKIIKKTTSLYNLCTSSVFYIILLIIHLIFLKQSPPKFVNMYWSLIITWEKICKIPIRYSKAIMLYFLQWFLGISFWFTNFFSFFFSEIKCIIREILYKTLKVF